MTTEGRKDRVTDADKDQQARAIAAALGAGWTVQAPRDGQSTRHVGQADGSGVSIWFTEYPAGRLEIHGIWPRGKDGQEYRPTRYGETSPTITVNASRPAAQIAAEIRRRFLPGYLALYAKKTAERAGAEQYQDRTADTLARILAATASEGGRQGRANGAQLSTVYLRESHVHRVEASGDSVRFEAFSCPVEVAIRVLDLLSASKAAERDREPGEAASEAHEGRP
jgi:hypothetical protein